EHFIENRAERKDVRAMIDSATFDLFRRHVPNCAHDLPGIGINTPRRNAGLGELCVAGARKLRYAEVENLYAAIFGNEKVVGFQIAVHDTSLVRGSESVRDL